jgi:hypothetical protein
VFSRTDPTDTRRARPRSFVNSPYRRSGCSRADRNQGGRPRPQGTPAVPRLPSCRSAAPSAPRWRAEQPPHLRSLRPAGAAQLSQSERGGFGRLSAGSGSLAEMDSIAFHCDGYSCSCSTTIRTARSRTSGGYGARPRPGLFSSDIAPSSQGLEQSSVSGHEILNGDGQITAR